MQVPETTVGAVAQATVPLWVPNPESCEYHGCVSQFGPEHHLPTKAGGTVHPAPSICDILLTIRQQPSALTN